MGGDSGCLCQFGNRRPVPEQGGPAYARYAGGRWCCVDAHRSVQSGALAVYPVFVGVGENDELFSESATRELFDEMPSEIKEFAILPGAKHAYFEDNSFHPLFSWVSLTFEK